MSVAHRVLVACLGASMLCGGALMAQEQPATSSAPGDPAQAHKAPQDLEPAVNTSSAADDAPARAAAHAATAPAPQAKPQTPPSGALAGTAKGNAKDRIELDTTQITGNRELPKVLYIVPWKHSDLSDLTGRPANSLLDEVLAPVDRDVFKRENRYYGALKPDEARVPAGTVGAPPDPAAKSGAAEAPRVRDEK
jgi:hypothetical protein